jgi:acetyl esterase/lipase
VNYRHTPEFRHPTQVNDAWDSYEWLATNAQSLGVDTNRVVVGGVSAGGSLASWVVWNAHQLQNQGQQMPLKIVGQVLCIPWLIHPDNHPGLLPGLKAPSSYEQNVDAPVLPWAIVRLFTDLLGAEDPKDPSLNVGVASDASLKGIPKTSFVVAGRDLLRDEGLYYAKRLQENG